ncbi:MAG: hypothetical protein ABI183_16775 [Polyangiaceae bacterium]
MTTSNLRAPTLLAAVSIVLVGVVAHAGVPAGRTLPSGPVKVGPIQVGPNNTPPPVLGWPHAILASASTKCRPPAPTEVILTLKSGQCASLTPGFYVNNTTTGQTYATTAIQVGSAVRARAFTAEHFSQGSDSFVIYAPNASLPLEGSGAQSIRSMRVEPANRSQICNDVRDGEIALFEGWDGGGDCVVLPADSYPNSDAMGIANDSISGVNNQTSLKAVLFWNDNFNKQGAVVSPHQNLPRLPHGGHFSDTIDNQTSSMQMVP